MIHVAGAVLEYLFVDGKFCVLCQLIGPFRQCTIRAEYLAARFRLVRIERNFRVARDVTPFPIVGFFTGVNLVRQVTVDEILGPGRGTN